MPIYGNQYSDLIKSTAWGPTTTDMYGLPKPTGVAENSSVPTSAINPAPIAGTDAFGQVPGPVGLPNPAANLTAQLPGLPGLNDAASGTISNKLAGNLSPATLRALQDASARFGLKTGMPGMGPQNSLAWNNLFSNIAGFAENNAQQGLQDYNSFIPTVSSTQTVRPETQIGLAESNAEKLAAPNPRESQLYAQQLFDKYMNGVRSAGANPNRNTPISPAGGTRSFSNPNINGVAYGATNPTGPVNPAAGQSNWNAWNASMPWNRTGTAGGGTDQQAWQQMLSSQFPELAGASPEDIAALGVNPWDLGWAGSAPSQGTFYAGPNPASAPAAGDWSNPMTADDYSYLFGD
jgi:hypothetical protein